MGVNLHALKMYVLGEKQCFKIGIKVLVATEGFMSEVRSWSTPAWQLSRRPTVAGTNKLNSLIFIRSRNPLYLVMTDQSASSTAFKILMGTALKKNPNPPKKKQNFNINISSVKF